MAYSFGGGAGSASGASSASASAGQGYGYATLSSSMDSGDIEGRTCRSHTVSRFSRGYSILTNGRPKIDRRYSPPLPTRSRHRAETGPSSTLYSTIQSGLMIPRSVFSKSSAEAKTSGTPKKPTAGTSRRRSTSSRPEPSRYRAGENRRSSTSKRPAAEKKTAGRFSLNSMRSRTSIASESSKKSSSSRKEKGKKEAAKSKKKSSSGYGMWSCFG